MYPIRVGHSLTAGPDDADPKLLQPSGPVNLGRLDQAIMMGHGSGMRQRPAKDLAAMSSAPSVLLDRRHMLHGLGAAAAATLGAQPASAASPVTTGASSLVANDFAPLKGKRVGLITNHTGRAGADHLADLMSRRRELKLAAILAPEHGFRGTAEAGATVRDGRDPKTGTPVYSLYGATRKPATGMLADVDCLVFDIQDVGVRFYTYISTMGLAMQAAAERRIPFVVLDRPNPIGGEDVSGFVLEPVYRSFVGQYPIPIVHGMTVGELARMIKAEGWLNGLSTLDLSVIPMTGWQRGMRWPGTQLSWIATSPNIPTFESALAYPGIGIVGETLTNEGRGTPAPFTQFGAPWLDAQAGAATLNALRLPGVRFEATAYVPVPIPNVAAHPLFEGQRTNAIKLHLTNTSIYRPLEVGIHVLCHLRDAARARGQPLLEKRDMFRKIAGTSRLDAALDRGTDGAGIIASWQAEVLRFKDRRAKYLLY